MNALLEMFRTYKEPGGSLPQLRKVVQVASNPCEYPKWIQQQLRELLSDIGIQYDWPY